MEVQKGSSRVKEHGVLNGVVILGRRARGNGVAVVGGVGIPLEIRVGGGGSRALSSGARQGVMRPHGSSIALGRGGGCLLLHGCSTLKGSGVDLKALLALSQSSGVEVAGGNGDKRESPGHS
jgi:hypothetical protein